MSDSSISVNVSRNLSKSSQQGKRYYRTRRRVRRPPPTKRTAPLPKTRSGAPPVSGSVFRRVPPAALAPPAVVPLVFGEPGPPPAALPAPPPPTARLYSALPANPKLVSEDLSWAIAGYGNKKTIKAAPTPSMNSFFKRPLSLTALVWGTRAGFPRSQGGFRQYAFPSRY